MGRRYQLSASLGAVMVTSLFTPPSWPSACTLTTSRASLAASAGHWTGTGCTGGSFVPGNGDTAQIAVGKVFKVATGETWVIGASGANDSTALKTLANGDGTGTAQVEVQGGATLVLRGNFSSDGWASTGSIPPLVMDAGSTLIFDASLSSSPATTRYMWRVFNLQFAANGTSGAHVTVTSCAAGNPLNATICGNAATPGLPGQLRASNVGAVPTFGQTLAATYTDFSYIGDATTYGQFAYLKATLYNTVFTHNTLDHCGPIAGEQPALSGANSIAFDYNVWTNSTQAVTVPNVAFSFDTWASGTRTITNNVFDACAQALNASHVTWDGNYLGAGSCGLGVKAAQTWTFVHQVADTGSQPFGVYSGGAANGYYFLDRAQDNPHWTSFDVATAAMSGWVFEEPDDFTTDSGELFVFTQTPSGTYTQQLTNSILLPTKTGKSIASIMSTTNAAPSDASLTLNIDHNSWIGSYSTYGLVDINESGASRVPITSIRSNILWSNGGSFTKAATQQYVTLLQDAITTADYNASGDGLVLTNPSCGGCTNQGKGYTGKWTATPGAHDIAANPFFADPNLRNVALWDTRYLKTAAATQWSNGLGTIALGAWVSDSHAGYYGGATINFRCVYATGCDTSAANSEPNAGSAWRTYWEFASLYDLRTAIHAGTTYTDGAIGCAGCTPIQALVKWVQRGFTPQNPALWCAGHDGETIGAVPFCANGKVMIGILAGM